MPVRRGCEAQADAARPFDDDPPGGTEPSGRGVQDDHGMGHGHANALVAYTLQESAKP